MCLVRPLRAGTALHQAGLMMINSTACRLGIPCMFTKLLQPQRLLVHL